jgi:hypothetical protein
MPTVPPQGWTPQPMSAPPGYPMSAPPGYPPMSAPPGYPPMSAPPGYPVLPPPPAKKSNTGLIVGIIVGVVVLLCIGGIAAVVALRGLSTTSNPTAAGSSTAPQGGITTPAHTTSAPTPTGETYNMGLGDGVKVTDGSDQWTVSVLGAHWFPKSCGASGTGTDPVLVVDVAFEVLQGKGSLNTLFDFTYVDSTGADSTSTGFTFCANPTLDDTFDLPAGQKRTGQVDFEVPSGKGGTLKYQGLMDTELIASWVIPGS